MNRFLYIFGCGFMGLAPFAHAASEPKALVEGRRIISEACPALKNASPEPKAAWDKLSPSQTRAMVALHLATQSEQCGWGKAVVFHEDDPSFAVYEPKQTVRHVGAFFERRGAKWFVSQVVPGMTAAKAGLKRGDEVVSVNGKPFDPATSFAGKTAVVQWRGDPLSKPVTKPLTIAADKATRFFDDVGIRSWMLFERDGKRFAQVAIPRVPDSMTFLRERLAVAEKEADVLILDLRDGVAEEKTGLLPLFLDSESPKSKAVFSKPILVLVNGRTAGTREWLASFLQDQNRGVLIGSPTAGAFVPRAERFFAGGKWVLRVPVAEKTPPPAEGKGLTPDIPVSQELMYAGGRDEIWERAVRAARDLDQGSKDTSG